MVLYARDAKWSISGSVCVGNALEASEKNDKPLAYFVENEEDEGQEVHSKGAYKGAYLLLHWVPDASVTHGSRWV